ncbi:MAG: hypothetical protein ABSD30_16645 [Candidatus Binatus sp.]|jgi:hypothetical protein
MKTLTQHEYSAWCEQRGLRIESDGILSQDSKSVVLGIPKETRRVLSLVCELLPKEPQFMGGLTWVVDTGSWSDDIIVLGDAILTLMRSSYRLNSIQDDSFCLFTKDERVHAQAFLAQQLLFGWGGYFVPDSAEYLFVINPDGVLEVVTESARWLDFFGEFPEKIGTRQHGKWTSRSSNS